MREQGVPLKSTRGSRGVFKEKQSSKQRKPNAKALRREHTERFETARRPGWLRRVSMWCIVGGEVRGLMGRLSGIRLHRLLGHLSDI